MKLINLIKYCTIITSLFVVVMVFSIGCKAKKPVATKHIEIVKDSVKEVIVATKIKEVSKPIKDSTSIKIPTLVTGQGKEQDSICNTRYQEALEQINFYKKSGSNQYKFYYDKEKKMLFSIAEMEETINEKDNTIYSLENKSINSVSKSETIQVKVYPTWLVVLGVMGVLFVFFLIFRIARIFT